MKSIERINTRMGAIGVLLTAMVVLFAQNYDKVPLLATHQVFSGYFGDTGGLKVGDAVQVAGIKVGSVEDVTIAGDKVKVVFSADDLELASQTELAIKTETVLGTKFLQVDSRGKGRLGRDQVIPLSRTSTPYLLTDSLEDLTNTISDLDTGQVTDAMDTLGQTLDRTAPNLDSALKGVDRFSNTIASRDQLVQSLLSNAESVTGVLSKRSEQVNRMILDGGVLFSALDQRRQEVDSLLQNIVAVTTQVQGLIDENQEQLRPSLDQLNRVVGLLDRHKADIQASLKPLQQYATSLGESVATGPFFNAYVMNLLPGQFLQPFIDAAFADQGIDPGQLGKKTYPVPCGQNTPPGTVPPGGGPPATDDGCPQGLPRTSGG